MVAFALHKGASNAFVGLLAALPFLTQLLQAPTVHLIERLRARRRIATLALLSSRLALAPLVVAAFAPSALALPIIFVVALAHFGLSAVAACAWNSWIRDLIPTARLGAFFARRSMYATSVGAAGGVGVGLALALGMDVPEQASFVFAALFSMALLTGLVSTWRLALVPEPRMAATFGGGPLIKQLAQPFTDKNFRRVIAFGGIWQFAVNIATPFFTVYFLQDLDLGLGLVMALAVVSQLANLAFINVWGAISDRTSNKSVLLAAAPTYLAGIAAVALTRSIDAETWRMPYLIFLHMVMGASAAGIGIATGNIVLKLAPHHLATPYISANALATSFAAGIAPMLGGALADYFAVHSLVASIQWIDPDAPATALRVAIRGWEFYFAGAALLGLAALHRLALVREEGEIEGHLVMQHVLLEARRAFLSMSPVAGVRIAAAFPAGALIELRQRIQRRLQKPPPA